MLAMFKCLKCHHKYLDKPGPTICPKCGHDYIKWVNYKEMREEWNKDGYVC